MRRIIFLSVFALLFFWACVAAVRGFFSSGASPNRWGYWPLILATGAALLAIIPPLIAFFRSWPIIRRAIPIDDPIWDTLMRDLSAQLSLWRRPALLIHPEPLRPATFGLFRPRIVLPCDCHSWTPSRRRVILLYELMHVARRDRIARRFVALLTACSQPLYWTTFRLLRRQNGQYVLRFQKPSSSALIPELEGKATRELARSERPEGPNAAPLQLRVDSAERLKRTREVPPVYPAAAKSAGIQGAVSFEIVISREGEPLDIRLLSSPDTGLTESALEAIRHGAMNLRCSTASRWRSLPTSPSAIRSLTSPATGFF